MKPFERAIVTFALLAFMLAGCAAIRPGPTGPSTQSPAAATDSAAPTEPARETAEATEPADETPSGTLWPTGSRCEVHDMSVDYVSSYTIEDVVGWGASFAYGTAGDPGAALYNTADGSKPRSFGPVSTEAGPGAQGMIYTPYPVRVERVLAGHLRHLGGRR